MAAVDIWEPMVVYYSISGFGAIGSCIICWGRRSRKIYWRQDGKWSCIAGRLWRKLNSSSTGLHRRAETEYPRSTLAVRRGSHATNKNKVHGDDVICDEKQWVLRPLTRSWRQFLVLGSFPWRVPDPPTYGACHGVRRLESQAFCKADAKMIFSMRDVFQL